MPQSHTSSSIPSGERLEQAQLRRRVIIELRPDEVPLLTTAQARHGTKRAAIVAALHAEARIVDLEAALASHDTDQPKRDAEAVRKAAQAQAEITRLTKERDQALAASDKTAKAATSHKDGAKRAAQSASAELAQLRDTVTQLGDELAEAEAHGIDWAYCARCHEWAGRDDWTWTPDGDDEYAYHTTCGDHGPGVIDPSSRLVWRAT